VAAQAASIAATVPIARARDHALVASFIPVLLLLDLCCGVDAGGRTLAFTGKRDK